MTIFQGWFKQMFEFGNRTPDSCVVRQNIGQKIIFYTLVMGFVHYGAVIIAYYEAVHCLFGHHKFC
jgi:hypothetical protein